MLGLFYDLLDMLYFDLIRNDVSPACPDLCCVNLNE
jgi:hypothetical protein